MGNNHTDVFQRFAQNPCGFRGNVTHAGTVETVAAESVFFTQFARNGISVGTLRHGLVERSIHHADIGQTREMLLRSQNAVDIGRIVQRSERNAGIEFVHYCLIDQNRFAVFFAAVGDAVADSFNAVVQAVFFKFFQQHTYGTGMIVTAGQSCLAFFAVFAERNDCFGRTQTFAETA